MSLQGLTGKEEYCMSGVEEAKQMLKKASKDLRALEVMLDPDSVDVGIFANRSTVCAKYIAQLQKEIFLLFIRAPAIP